MGRADVVEDEDDGGDGEEGRHRCRQVPRERVRVHVRVEAQVVHHLRTEEA